MTRLKTALALGLALGTLGASSLATAQTAPAPAVATPPAPLDPQRLALAKQIIAIAFPPAEREAKMHTLLQALTSQITASLDLDSVKDPGLHTIFADYLTSVPTALKPLVNDFVPKQMEAMTHAYARMFTQKELADTLAFAKTPSGATFLQRSMDVMADPEVGAANTTYMRTVMTKAQAMTEELKTKVQAYAKDHPEAFEDQ